jgi:formylmethanofuran dehydrogenase subunit A
MTRTLPARLLGLKDRGQLTPGARADVAVYDFPEPEGNWGEALSRCRLLLKAGEIVVEDFQVVQPEAAKTGYFRRAGAEATNLTAELCQFLSFRPQNLWVTDELGVAWVGL